MAKYVHPNMIIDSSAAFLKSVTFDSSVYFQGVTHINAPAAVSSQTPFALVLESGSGTDLQVKSVQLGTMAKENATSWDASLSAIRTDIGHLETSVGALDTLTQSHTTQLGIHNASIGVLTSLTAVHDSSLGFLNAYRLIQDASIEAVGGAWKPYVDGSLAARDSSIIALFAKNAAQDASIIRIDASLNDTVELFDVIDASLQELWNYNAIQDASIALAISGTTSAWNGLTRTDNSIGLGGTLSQNTVINSSDYDFIIGGGDLDTQEGSYGGIEILSVEKPIAINIRAGDANNLAGLAVGSDGTLSIYFSGGAIIADEASTGGLVYSDDYSATFVANSLITKSFAESLVGEVSTRLSTAETDITNIETSLGILNNWNVSQDASIVTLRNTTLSALQTANNGLTANDTNVALGGALTHDTDIDAAGYTFSVTGGLSVYGTLTVDGSVTYVNSVDLNVSDNIITVNYGETGAGVSKGFAGLKVDRGTEDDYVFVFAEATDTFRIGIANESGLPTGTQAVATREDTPEGFGIPFWNGSLYRFDTSSGFEFTPGVGLSLPIATDDPAEATALMITPAGLVVSRELGTMAFATATDYTLKTLFDSSVAAIWTKFGSVDTSIAGLDTLTQTHTTDINNLESSVGALDLLTQNHTQSIADLSTGKLDAVATVTGIDGGHQVFSNEADNIAYIKKIVAGTGATITSDASTITIAVSGAAGYVSKYAGTFDGTAGTSLSITAATHGLGIGPLQVTVYDGTDQVWVDVDCAANGDITLEWTGGSLSASCKYIIMG